MSVPGSYEELVALGEKFGECLVWTRAKSSRGYGYIRTPDGMISAHRLAWTLARGPISPGMFICHHCDNPPCFLIQHLFEGTPADNMEDARRKGRLHGAPGDRNGMRTRPDRRATGDRHWTNLYPGLRLVGERNPMAKLTNDQVLEIRRRHVFRGGPNGGRALAAEFGVAESVISNIVNNKQWRGI